MYAHFLYCLVSHIQCTCSFIKLNQMLSWTKNLPVASVFFFLCSLLYVRTETCWSQWSQYRLFLVNQTWTWVNFRNEQKVYPNARLTRQTDSRECRLGYIAKVTAMNDGFGGKFVTDNTTRDCVRSRVRSSLNFSSYFRIIGLVY